MSYKINYLDLELDFDLYLNFDLIVEQIDFLTLALLLGIAELISKGLQIYLLIVTPMKTPPTLIPHSLR